MLTIKTDRRDRFYFDRYQYCFNFRMEEMSCVREVSHDKIDRMIDYRNMWRQRSPNFGGSWQSRRGQVTDEQRTNCHAMCDFLLAQKDYKLVVSQDWGYVYTNDISLARAMESLPYILPLSIKQSVLDRPRDTLRIKNSRHEFRTYFRAQRLDQNQRQNLVDFLSNQQSIRPGPGLKQFMTADYAHTYVSENFFIDHDGMGIITMLGLVLPRATRKTVKLINDK